MRAATDFASKGSKVSCFKVGCFYDIEMAFYFHLFFLCSLRSRPDSWGASLVELVIDEAVV